MYYNLANSDAFEKEEHGKGSVDEEIVDLKRQVRNNLFKIRPVFYAIFCFRLFS